MPDTAETGTEYGDHPYMGEVLSCHHRVYGVSLDTLNDTLRRQTSTTDRFRLVSGFEQPPLLPEPWPEKLEYALPSLRQPDHDREAI
jgi:hypothetical protein